MRFRFLNLAAALLFLTGCASVPSSGASSGPPIYPIGSSRPASSPAVASVPGSPPAAIGAFNKDPRPVRGITLGWWVSGEEFDRKDRSKGLKVKLVPLGPDGLLVKKAGIAWFVLYERQFETLNIRGKKLFEWRVEPEKLIAYWEEGYWGGYNVPLAWPGEPPNARYAVLDVFFEAPSGDLFTFTEPTITMPNVE